MADKTLVRKRASSVSTAPRFSNYSNVIIHIDDKTQVSAKNGNNAGRTLELDNPFGSQALADRILSKLRGYQYQPYEADGVSLDPAVEIGDGVTVNDIYGGIYIRHEFRVRNTGGGWIYGQSVICF